MTTPDIQSLVESVPTPLTDYNATTGDRMQFSEVVSVNFARGLERRAIAAESERDQLATEILRLRAELAEEKRKVAELERENLDHAEDWAFCGINPNSETAKRLVAHHHEREQCRKDSKSLDMLEQIATVDWPFGNTAIIKARIEIKGPFATKPTVRTALAALTTPSGANYD